MDPERKLSTVAKLILARQQNGSLPQKRQDDRHVCLVIEGGAMRGVVSAGMVAALEHLGLRDSFDSVIGSSAGAINGAYFVARQARYGTTIFYENINNSRFINLGRVFTRRPIVSLEFLLDEVCLTQKPLDSHAVLTSDLPLHVVASSVSKRAAIALADFRTREELMDALRASARIPLFAGPPVPFRGDLFLDASMYESIPLAASATLSPTDVVVLLTRPLGELRSAPGFVDKYIVAPYLKQFTAALAADYLSRAATYRAEIEALMKPAVGEGRARVLTIAPARLSRKVSSLETNRAKLVAGAVSGFAAIVESFGFGSYQMVETILPYSDGKLLGG